MEKSIAGHSYIAARVDDPTRESKLYFQGKKSETVGSYPFCWWSTPPSSVTDLPSIMREAVMTDGGGTPNMPL
jgi:hypothetical protein